jgi:hypothetical protein
MVAMPTLSYATGPLSQGKLYYWRIDANNGCPDPCAGAIWNFRVEECVKSTSAFITVWRGGGSLPWNRPDCWCYKRNCRGDADNGKQLGLYWVYSNDLAILKAGFGKTDTNLTGNRICADFMRDKQLGLYRVYSNDLTRLKSYFGKTEANVKCCDVDATPLDCTVGAAEPNYVFWMP